MSAPLVSVVMGTYNHASFVAESIQSVLAQDFHDFEFLIADDGSSDATPHVVASQSDPRIDFRPNAVNQGAAIVLNDLLQRARGRYVAVINSDDAWYPGKLAEQVAYLEENPAVGATFGRVNFVDRDGGPISKDTLGFGYVFDQPNRTRGEWLNQFFWHGNCLCHPSVLIRRDVYEKVGLYDNRYRQLPDLDMWIRVVKVTDIHVSESTMVRFRIMPGENTSSDTYTNRVRTLNEHFFIAMEFFDGISYELLRQGFGDHLRKPQLSPDLSSEIEKAFLFQHKVLSLDHVYKIISLMKLRDLLACPTTRSVLAQHYDFDDKTFQCLSAETDGLQRVMLEVSNASAVTAGADAQLGRDVDAVSTRELGKIIRRRLMTRARMVMKQYNLPFSHWIGGTGAGAFQADRRPDFVTSADV